MNGLTHRPQRLALLVLGVLAACSLAACDRFLSASDRVARAEKQYAAGNFNAAMEDAKTALERDPQNVAGRVLLARLSLRLGDVKTARSELDRAVEAGASGAAVSELGYTLMLAEGRAADVVAALEAESDLNLNRRLALKAAAQLDLGQLDAAGLTLEEARRLDASDPEITLTYARWLWARGDLDDATRELDALLEREPAAARAALYRGRLAMAVGDASRAAASFDTALDVGARELTIPEQAFALSGLVESRLALGDGPGAERELARLSARAPDAYVTRYLKARLAYARGDFATATSELQWALATFPEDPSGRLLLGAVLLEQGSHEQAASVLTTLLSEYPGTVEARKLLARVYLARGDTVAARKVLAEAPADAARDAGADWISGSILLMGGDTQEAIAMLEQGAAAEPGNVPLKLDLARAYLMAGRRDEALSILQGLPASEGGRRRAELLVIAEVAGKRAAEARAAILELAAERPDDTALQTMCGAWLLASGGAREARDVFQRVAKRDPRDVDAQLGVAAAQLQLGEAAAAEQALRKAMELEPANERAYLGLAAVAITRGDRPAAQQWFERAIGANPGAVESRLRLAELTLAQGDPLKARALFDQALAVTAARPATLARVGRIQMGSAQYDAALARFNESASLGYAPARIDAARALMALGRTEEARGNLEGALRDKPGWIEPAAVLMQLDVGEKKYERALSRAAALQRAGAPVEVVEALRGEVLFASGDNGGAADAFARAAKVRPSAPLAIKTYRAARAAGRAAPETALLAWLEIQPEDPLVRVTLAEHFQQRGDRAAAIAQYERAAQVWQGPVLLNNLAWLYYETGDRRALDLARRAHEAAPERAEIADTYGWLLVESGDLKAGLPILERAARGAPGVGDIQYHYAAALARAGQKEAAATALKRLMADNANFPSQREAEALLRTLL